MPATQATNDTRPLLEPFRPGIDGPWNRETASHLARRATFGAPPALVDALLAQGPAEAPRRLLAARDAGDGPRVVAETARRVGDLETVQGWWGYRMLLGEAPVIDKLALFWHGHFATSEQKVDNARLMMRQIELFQEKGAGNFGELLLEIARDPAMLIWLDSNSNRRGTPNENWARELMELFSLGIGNYTEVDIKEAARAFTGWHVRRGEYFFNRRAHDESEKRVFEKAGVLGGDDVVALCLGKPACSEFIAGKLFEYYVRLGPHDALRTELGALYDECGKHTGEFLARLWSSRVFYESGSRRSLVSSPADFVIGSLRTVGARANAQHVAKAMATMGQDLLRPPSVKGWDAGMAWLDSNRLLARFRFAAAIAGGGEVQCTVPWDELDAEGVGGIVARFFPDGLPHAVRAALDGAVGNDSKLGLAGCLQLPEYQYI